MTKSEKLSDARGLLYIWGMYLNGSISLEYFKELIRNPKKAKT